MNDRISSLRLFVRVARTGSFTAAGREVGLSQPSASRIISKLEEDLGAALFIRSTHAVKLTEAGSDYLKRLDPILAALEEADHLVSGDGELRGHLRVGAATSLRVGNDYFIKQPDGRLLVRIRSCGFSPLESLQV